MKLYSHPGTCSSSCHIALKEADQDFELVKVNLFGDRVLDDGRNFNEINPKNSVPVLELDNGELITEVCAILQYIADTNPESGLAPENGSIERVRLQEWLSYLNSELHTTFALFFSPALDGKMKEMAIQKKDERLHYIDEHLKNNDYLLGDKLSIADIYLHIVCTWPPMFEMDISEFKNIAAFQARMLERQSVQEVHAAAV